MAKLAITCSYRREMARTYITKEDEAPTPALVVLVVGVSGANGSALNQLELGQQFVDEFVIESALVG